MKRAFSIISVLAVCIAVTWFIYVRVNNRVALSKDGTKIVYSVYGKASRLWFLCTVGAAAVQSGINKFLILPGSTG